MRSLLVTLAVATLFGCATPQRAQFPDKPIVWVEQDMQAVPEPDEYWSGLIWDAVDKTVFRPISHAFLIEEVGEAKNVNALGEVPNSSWYTNRMAVEVLSPERVAQGPCPERSIDRKGPWEVVSGKVNGANPGFVIRDKSDDRMYLLKFDGPGSERATSADVIGSKIYWAAGFSTPCNEVIYFDPSVVKLTKKSSKKDELGRKTAMTTEDVEGAFRNAPRTKDGLVRGSASLFLSGKPLGPLTYDGIKKDDLNDVVAHEDRRELRGSRLLAAWLNHFDAREQNTFSTFIKKDETSGLGYVQHHIIDFGDCFGSQWEWDLMSRRFGHSYYLHPGHVAADFVSLGFIQRPWDTAKLNEESSFWGYYDVENFNPEAWLDAYPNIAFNRMRDGDAYWATKIISRFSDDHIRALVAQGKITDARAKRYLERTLIGRRDRIVKQYFSRLTPLDFPLAKGSEVCLEDLYVSGGYADAQDAFYQYKGNGDWEFVKGEGSQVCIPLKEQDGYQVVQIKSHHIDNRDYAKPLSLHLRKNASGWQVAGMVR